MPATFDAFFHAATATEQNPDGNIPYDYQRRLAGGDAGPIIDEPDSAEGESG